METTCLNLSLVWTLLGMNGSQSKFPPDGSVVQRLYDIDMSIEDVGTAKPQANHI